MKKKKPKGTSVNPKRSAKSSPGTLSIKKQVEQANKMASDAVSKLAYSPNIDHEQFGVQYNRIKKAFEIMHKVIILGEEMKKLKEK